MYKVWNGKKYIELEYYQIPWLNINFGRLDGPSVISFNNYQYYCYKGKYHRIDGPAIILPFKHTWWLHGNRYNFKDFIENNNYISETEKLLLCLKY
jgi:hypothetical protein